MADETGLVPEEAIEAAAKALETGEVDADDPRAWFRGHAEAAVRAAAPLILAAELSDQADGLERQAAAIGYPPDGSPEAAMVLVLGNVARNMRARASVLRGEGHRDG